VDWHDLEISREFNFTEERDLDFSRELIFADLSKFREYSSVPSLALILHFKCMKNENLNKLLYCQKLSRESNYMSGYFLGILNGD